MERSNTLGYYDKILVAVAASLGGGVLAGVVTADSYRVGLLVGSLLATLFIYDAMFRHPPRPTPSRRVQTAAVVWHVFLGMLLVTVFL